MKNRVVWPGPSPDLSMTLKLLPTAQFVCLKAYFHSLKSERAGEKRNVDDVSACVVKQSDYVYRLAPAEFSTLVKVKSF